MAAFDYRVAAHDAATQLAQNGLITQPAVEPAARTIAAYIGQAYTDFLRKREEEERVAHDRMFATIKSQAREEAANEA